MSGQSAGEVADPIRVGIVSLGLIGGSIARKLVEQGIEVRAWNPSPAPLELAAEHGIGAAGTIRELCSWEPDVLILANPLRAMQDVIGQVAEHVGPGTAVTDVGSVKGPIATLVRDAGIGPQFVGAHPMAGTEQTGFAAANPRLLDDAHWALAIEPETSAENFLRIAALITGPLGGQVHAVDPRTHDEAAALISHLPHVVATELLNLVARAPVQDLAVRLAAGSFRDGTRVAHTDPRRTEAMVVDNALWVAPALRVMVRDLSDLADRLESNAPVSAFFDRADPLRERARQERSAHPDATTASASSELDLTNHAWREVVVAACAAGAVITGADQRASKLEITS